jgi:hypothetical protein
MGLRREPREEGDVFSPRMVMVERRPHVMMLPALGYTALERFRMNEGHASRLCDRMDSDA